MTLLLALCAGIGTLREPLQDVNKRVYQALPWVGFIRPAPPLSQLNWADRLPLEKCITMRLRTTTGSLPDVAQVRKPLIVAQREPIAEEIDHQRLAPDAINIEPADALSRPGIDHRIRLRRYLILADSLTALVFGAFAADEGDYPAAGLVLLWGVYMTVRLDRERRIGEFLQPKLLFSRFWSWIAAAAVLGVFVSKSTERAQFAILSVAGMYAISYLSRRIARLPRVQEIFEFRLRESLVLVGDREEVARTLREWVRVDTIEVVGVCLPENDDGPPVVEGHPVLGSARDIVAVCQRFPVDAVALHDCGDLGGRQLARLQWALEQSKTFISLITPVANTDVERVHARAAGRRLIVDVAPATPSGVVVVLRAMLDRIAATFLLILSLPILVTSAMAIKLTSRGPVVFRQLRVRENNRTFMLYKLRTMAAGAETHRSELEEQNEVGGGLFKIRTDPRVTKVGRLLRQLSVDELPQLVNVIKGEMALVGPRPALPSEVALYDDMARRRLAIKPGLTGLWQVSGRSNLSWEESVRLDMDYVDNWSPKLDAAIALDTFRAVIRRNGAY